MRKGLFNWGIIITIVGIVGLGIALGLYIEPPSLEAGIILLFIVILAVGILIGTYALTSGPQDEITALNAYFDRSPPGGAPIIEAEPIKESTSPNMKIDQMNSLEILNKRYALGEISREQYLLMKEDLK